MSALAPLTLPSAPALFGSAPDAALRFWEFFTLTIRNRNTRRAYFRCAERFAAWCAARHVHTLDAVTPMHVAAFIEQLQAELSAPTVKQHLAALRMLFDWLVVGHVVAVNPAHSVRGPRYSVRRGKTPVLTQDEARLLLGSLPDDELGRRDRALIMLMLFTFARVGAAIAMDREDVYPQAGRLWVRLREKGGKTHDLPCHPELARLLKIYMQSGAEAGPLFLSAGGRRMTQPDVFLMIRRRTAAAGIATRVNCHSFRATGITAYLLNGGRLEVAQLIANHESPRTTMLYDRRGDSVAAGEVDRIMALF